MRIMCQNRCTMRSGRPGWLRLAGLLAVLHLALLGGPSTVFAADPVKQLENLPAAERQRMIKASFIYNFARFTNWPDRVFATPSSPLRFCVVGTDAAGPTLEAIEGKRVRGRKIVIDRPLWIHEAKKCHVLFVGTSARNRILDILRFLRREPILTVGDSAGFAELGGIVGMRREGANIKFEINPLAVRDAGLQMSSRLLSLARIVGPQRQLGKSN